MKRLFISIVLAMVVMLCGACGSDSTEELIVGTWQLVSESHQSIGHPDQNYNGITTQTHNPGESITLVFYEDNSGLQIDPWGGGADTTRFTYFAAGNLLNMSIYAENRRIDAIDEEQLVITDTATYHDIYTNSYNRSIEFTQQLKDTYTYRRK